MRPGSEISGSTNLIEAPIRTKGKMTLSASRPSSHFQWESSSTGSPFPEEGPFDATPKKEPVKARSVAGNLAKEVKDSKGADCQCYAGTLHT